MLSVVISGFNEFSFSIPGDEKPVAVQRHSFSSSEVELKHKPVFRWLRRFHRVEVFVEIEALDHTSVFVGIELTDVVTILPEVAVDSSITDFNRTTSPAWQALEVFPTITDLMTKLEASIFHKIQLSSSNLHIVNDCS